MASIFAGSDGVIIGFAGTFAEARSFFPVPPASTAASLDFDEALNAALVADIQAHTILYKLPIVAGAAQLQKNGVAVAVAASSPLYSVYVCLRVAGIL